MNRRTKNIISIILGVFVVLSFLSLVKAEDPYYHPNSEEENSGVMPGDTSAATGNTDSEEEGNEEETLTSDTGEEGANEEGQTGQTSSWEEETEDIVNTMPSGHFLHPESGASLKEEIRIKFIVEGAILVEFYLRRPESLMEMYLGQGYSSETNVWERSFDTNLIPNGKYFLFPKIVNEYGEYFGERISFYVENEIETEEEKVNALEEEINQSETEIQTEEQQVVEEKETVKEGIITEVEDFIEEGGNTIKDEEREQLKTETEEKLRQLYNKTEENLEKALQTAERQEREELKNEIVKDIEEITKPITEATKEQQKAKTLQLEEAVRERIDSLMQKLEHIYEKKADIEIRKEEVFSKDFDKDGLPDYEEIRIGTDPFNPDSDRDGFIDGSEIALSFDPLNPSPADKIKYQNPREIKKEPSEVFRVEQVETSFLEGREHGLKIKGKALPNSFVTIYVFSLPTIIITKADANGNWEYILDKSLADGQHAIYATLTDNHGEIEESSTPFLFVKTEDKILRFLEPEQNEIASPAETLQRSFAVLVVAIIVFSLGIALTMVGIILREKTKVSN
jgi:hypothetical protein